MSENKSSANTIKPPQKRIEKVVSGAAKARQKNAVNKLANNFFAEDIKTVTSCAVSDVVVPLLKKALYEGLNAAWGMLLYGKSGRSSNKNDSRGRPSYQGYYDDRREYSDGVPANRKPLEYAADDLWLEDYGDAENVLYQMRAYLSDYGTLSVAEAKQFAGIQYEYTDNAYGWTDLRSAYVHRVRDGYLIVLPKAVPIKNL